MNGTRKVSLGDTSGPARGAAHPAHEETARSTWLTTPYGAPYRVPPASVTFEISRRPLTGGWWVRMLDRGGLPLRVAVTCAHEAFLAAVAHQPGEYHLLPIDAVTGEPAAARAPGCVKVDVGAIVPARSIEATARARGPL